MSDDTTNNTGRFTRSQILTMISTASLNFCSMICYSILGPFFPQEALKKGVSNTMIGLIFGCFAVFNFSASLIFGKYLVNIGPKFMFVTGLFVSACATILFGLLDKAPDGTIFIVLCFVVRSVDAIGFGASITASFSILAKAFPNNIATAMFHLKVGYVGLVFLGLALSYSLSSPLLGLISDRYPGLRKWLLIVGSIGTAICFFMLGPVPIFHIESKLWLFIFILVLNGFCIGLSGLPVYPEMLSCAYENGFEEGLSTLGLISGLFTAMWSSGSFVGPTLGGFLNEKVHFENAAAIQGLFPLVCGIFLSIFYMYESYKKSKRPSIVPAKSTDEERTPLM
ncbi:MFS-type transporter SLC18B1 [Pelobates cultripes]|uniref:MFS-type transporter SLC18B1 n=1 Tax=Pelobates cultripes TaxID=61616 RepID=A0AAD1VV17_PELCU|nr:MFS-type transporter SLC18B1 [Pelobates cultripes]